MKMNNKIHLLQLLHFVAFAVIAEISLINADDTITTTEGIVNKNSQIVIKIPERNFDEPNLADFENCSKNYDNCKQSCENSIDAIEDCIKQCPICPILVVQKSVVQGINDTDFRASSKTNVVNSTHIIRLTNEIHNIIENKLGNITARNENHIYIQSNNSTTMDNGGKFGLGYDEHGPCCFVVRNKSEQKRKLCGQVCKARVMLERTIVQCADEMDIESCREIFEYKPYRRSSRHISDTSLSSSSTHNRCSYQAEWPYVSCNNRRQNEYCSAQCLELAYGYILRYGVPLHCVNCFKNFNRLGINAPPLGYSPHMPSDDNDDDSNNDDGWLLEKTKCRQADGTLRDDCISEDEEGSGDDGFLFPNKEVDAAFKSFQSLEPARHRRNSFRRSKYSRRYRSKNFG